MQVQDFRMSQGDDKTISVEVTEASDGSATNITACTIAWKASRSINKTAAISKSTSSGITITNGSGGVFQITLDPADTASLIGDYYHEAQITFTDGEIATVLKGVMTVEPDLV